MEPVDFSGITCCIAVRQRIQYIHVFKLYFVLFTEDKTLKGRLQFSAAVNGSMQHECIKMQQTYRRNDDASFEC